LAVEEEEALAMLGANLRRPTRGGAAANRHLCHLPTRPFAMPFSRTIWYNNKPLILTTDAAAVRRTAPLASGFMHFEGAFPRAYRLALRHLEKSVGLGAVIEDASEGALIHTLHDRFKPIDAGGGVVENEHGGVLMIFRRGRWDLPKGKRDEGEDLATCAVREVLEETGLERATLGERLPDTYHIYSQRGEELVKRTAWFRMRASADQKLVPQAAEAIQEVRWVAPAELPGIAFKTYEAIRQVLASAGYRVGGAPVAH